LTTAQHVGFDQIKIVASPNADAQTLWRLEQAEKHKNL